MSSFALSIITFIITISNGQLPGPYKQGIFKDFGTVDISQQNNCEWENSHPMKDTSIFPFGEFAAINVAPAFFNDAVACGTCYELECIDVVDTDSGWAKCQCIPNAKVTVMVVDYGDDVTGFDYAFDLPQSVATQLITGNSRGNCYDPNGIYDGSKYNIQFRQVCCEHHQNIAIYNYEGMTDHWLSFVVTQVRGYGAITNFWIREDGRDDYYECQRNTNGINKNWVCDPWTDDNTRYYDEYISQGNSLGQGLDPPYNLPIDIKLRDSNGDELESLDVITSFVVDEEFDFRKNFEAACEGEESSTTDAPETTISTTEVETSTTETSTTETSTTETSTTVTSTTETSTTETSTTVTSTTETSTSTTEEESSTTEVESTTNTPESVTDDPLRNYVNCMEAPVDACYEAFPEGCCERKGNECVIHDPPSASDECRVVPTTTNVAQGTDTATTQGFSDPSNANYVNAKLIGLVVLIFHAIL